MTTLIETIERKHTIVKIYLDDDPQNPREWDNLGIMVCWHNHYGLGDKHDFHSPQDFNDEITEQDNIVLPLYLYDHSGITMSTSNSRYPFCDRWDSGQVGYIYVSKTQVRHEYGWKLLTQSRIDKIKTYLQNEVSVYDDYLTGNVYGFEVICNKCNKCKNNIDSCWGFYGQDWNENGLMIYVGEDQLCDNCQAELKEKNRQMVMAI